MARWTSQQDCRSRTDTALRRTAYLEPLAPAVDAAIKRYLGRDPGAEDVTLAVFAAIGQARLDRIGSRFSPRRRNQDVGLFVAQRLVAMYGAERVLTWRAKDGVSAAARRNTRPDVDWVMTYTPHRVVVA